MLSRDDSGAYRTTLLYRVHCMRWRYGYVRTRGATVLCGCSPWSRPCSGRQSSARPPSESLALGSWPANWPQPGTSSLSSVLVFLFLPFVFRCPSYDCSSELRSSTRPIYSVPPVRSSRLPFLLAVPASAWPYLLRRHLTPSQLLATRAFFDQREIH